MIKFVTILAMVILMARSQRPPYAGSSNRYPVVLPQYLEGREPAAAPAVTDSVVNRIDGSQDIANRISGSANGSSPAGSSSSSSTPATLPADIPVDALGDIELINRIKTWPREKQPFWFINWQQIQEHRGDANTRAQTTATQPNTQSFFAG